MSYYPASYWITLGVYFVGAVTALYFLARRRDCFSCSVPTAVRRSIFFALIVTPSVIPGWVLTPIPASVFFVSMVWSVLFSPEFLAATFVQATVALVLLPIAVVALLTFLAWLWLRRRRQSTSHPAGLHPNA